MNGPSEFHVIGTISDWSFIDRLDRIRAPTLLISGRYDEATPIELGLARGKSVVEFREGSRRQHARRPAEAFE
jgi:hypothetical protein